MTAIATVRPVLLSAPYATPNSFEVRWHLRSGFRTTGLVEVTLEDGTTGLGEGYLAVFAPHVFAEIVTLLAPYLIGKDAADLHQRYRDMCMVTDYWSLEGAARHAISACEIALLDAQAKQLGVPSYTLLGGRRVEAIRVYGSGGDSTTPVEMQGELGLLGERGIGLFKIRARKHQVEKTAWTLEQGARMGIEVAVDMAQNLSNPAQTVGDVVRFVEGVGKRSRQPIWFLEEALGPADLASYPLLRAKLSCLVAGGEIVTTAYELCRRVQYGCYDLAQPDATVIGGMHQVLEVFTACRQNGKQAVVHCWGSAVCMMANYHAAFAGGGQLAEWPMPWYPLRDELLIHPLRIERGRLLPPIGPGLGVALSPELEARYPFREDAVYTCLIDDTAVAGAEEVWR